MAAIKPYFYKVCEGLPDVCEGRDIRRYMSRHFGEASGRLKHIDPAMPLPEGPFYYSDSPRDCVENPDLHKYEMADAISDCIRMADKRDAVARSKGKKMAKSGAEKKALADLIAVRIKSSPQFREDLLAFGLVPQSWSAVLQPADPAAKLKKRDIMSRLIALDDRDYSHPTNARGPRHPLAQIMDCAHFTDKDRLDFIADHVIGRSRRNEAAKAVRIGNRHNFREYITAHWLEQNGALVLETVGDIVQLQKHFAANCRLKKGAEPELKVLEPGDLRLKL